MRSAVCFCISAQWNLQHFRQTLISSGKLKFMNRCRLQAESSIFVDFRSISNLRVFSAKGSSTAGLIYDASRGLDRQSLLDQIRWGTPADMGQCNTHTDTHTHTQTLTHTHTQTQNPKHTHNTKYTHTHTVTNLPFFSHNYDFFPQFLLFEFWLFSDCDLLQQTHI